MTDDDDAELAALIDNELDEDRRSALLARLAADGELRRRYDELREAGAPIAASLDALLEQAPLARLRAVLPADGPIRQPSSRRFGGTALRELAAGIVIGVLAAGAAAWVALSLGLNGEGEDWRMAVLEYAELYTNETFAPIHPDPSLQALELSGLSAQVGVKLTPEKLALPGLRFTTAFILSYDDSPLALIAYVDSKGAPVLFCVIANGASNAPARTQKRGEFLLADWSRDGHSFLVLARKPAEQVAEWAQTLKERI
jgi:anti-sigma factor RsiW